MKRVTAKFIFRQLKLIVMNSKGSIRAGILSTVLFIVLTLMGYSEIYGTELNYQNPDNPNKTISVALLQLHPSGADVDANLKKGEEYCRKAKAMGADIALFPEEWSIGYSRYHWPGTKHTKELWPMTFDEWSARAVDQNSPFIDYFRKLAAELEMAIVITYLEKWEDRPRNSATVIDLKGNLLMTYAKVHTSDFHPTESNCTPGDDFYVCDLPVRNDIIKLGIMICYDREQPESARILMLKGAEIILTPNACNLSDMLIKQFQVRAFENTVGVAMANYPRPNHNGRSCAFDASGKELFIADDSENVFVVQFDMNKIRERRKTTIHGNAYRRPLKYNKLVSKNVDSVFIRKNGLGEKFEREKR